MTLLACFSFFFSRFFLFAPDWFDLRCVSPTPLHLPPHGVRCFAVLHPAFSLCHSSSICMSCFKTPKEERRKVCFGHLSVFGSVWPCPAYCSYWTVLIRCKFSVWLQKWGARGSEDWWFQGVYFLRPLGMKFLWPLGVYPLWLPDLYVLQPPPVLLNRGNLILDSLEKCGRLNANASQRTAHGSFFTSFEIQKEYKPRKYYCVFLWPQTCLETGLLCIILLVMLCQVGRDQIFLTFLSLNKFLVRTYLEISINDRRHYK